MQCGGRQQPAPNNRASSGRSSKGPSSRWTWGAYNGSCSLSGWAPPLLPSGAVAAAGHPSPLRRTICQRMPLILVGRWTSACFAAGCPAEVGKVMLVGVVGVPLHQLRLRLQQQQYPLTAQATTKQAQPRHESRSSQSASTMHCLPCPAPSPVVPVTCVGKNRKKAGFQ